MSVSIQALWLLCGIGAAVFAAGPVRPRRVVAVALGFGLAAWAGPRLDAATVAGLAALVAGCGIFRPTWITLPAFAAGFLAAVLGTLLTAQGVMQPVALLSAALIPVVTLALAAKGGGFAPETVREEGMLLMLALGLGAAVGPAVLDGWRSAGSMNATGEATQVMPAWVISVTGASLVIGGAWSFWRHQ